MTGGNEVAGATAHRETNADGAQNSTGSWAILGAIILLLVYQGYTLSVSGIASPWIAKSFHLSQPALARLFAWMSISAFGSMLLARLADRVGRRLIILSSLVLAPVFALGAALAPWAWLFALFQVLISALLGGSVSSATVMLAEELPMEQRARGTAIHEAFETFAGEWPELGPAEAGPRFAALYMEELKRAGAPQSALAREDALAREAGAWHTPKSR